MDTDNFIAYMNDNLLHTEELKEKTRTSEWIDGKGLPSNCPVVKSDRIEAVDNAVKAWTARTLSTDALGWENWLYQERYRFLTNLGDEVTLAQISDLNNTYNISSTGNNEVLFAWLEQAIRKQHTDSYPRLEEFLVNIGRRKFLTPLYRAMLETDQTNMAVDIYKKARKNYHSVATDTMDELLQVNE